MKNILADFNTQLINMKVKVIFKTFLFLLIASLLFNAKSSAGNDDNKVGLMRTTLEKWVETRQLISRENQDFEISKEMLGERIDLIKSEIDSLHEKMKETNQSISEMDNKRTERVDENEKLKEASDLLNTIVIDLETKTRELLKKLPDPILDRVELLSQRIPQDEKKTKLSIGERFQNIIGVLNEINKFNREITITSEVRELPDGTSSEVASMYIGIGKAYYANVNGNIAGIGTVGLEGWVWHQANEAAAEIAEAISILKNEAPAAFVLLPIEIQ